MIITMADENMADKNGADLTKADLDKLEHQVDELVGFCTHLREENGLLRERQVTLVTERAQLIDKAELARSHVAAMVARLKTMVDDT